VDLYNARETHRLLVSDEVRTRAFRDAIKATVQPEDVVLDVGAGSGILSLFAAQAGARRVYAIERAPGAAGLARQLVAGNNLSETVQVLQTDAASAILPEHADVLISEWLGAYGVDENMLAPVLLARDRWLKPGGLMIPARVTAYLAPVSHESCKQAIEFHDRAYDLDLSALAPFHLEQAISLPGGAPLESLRAEPQALWTTDCNTMPAEDAATPYAAELKFRLTGGGVNGLVTWFVAEMPGGGELRNGPGPTTTHWGQLLFPLARTQHLQQDDELAVGFHNIPGGPFGSNHIWAAHLGAGDREVHDTRRRPQAAIEPPWRAYVPSTV
jgi:predicted RNA methylase